MLRMKIYIVRAESDAYSVNEKAVGQLEAIALRMMIPETRDVTGPAIAERARCQIVYEGTCGSFQWKCNRCPYEPIT